MKSPVEIFMEIVVDDDKYKSILVTDGINEVWLPRSQIEIEYRKDGVQITLPEWLAIKTGIV